eukprot:jgi/Bigna1/135157/aug1.28_g9865
MNNRLNGEGGRKRGKEEEFKKRNLNLKYLLLVLRRVESGEQDLGVVDKYSPKEEDHSSSSNSESGLMRGINDSPNPGAKIQVKPSSIVNAGGAGYKILKLLDGTADAYVFPRPGMYLWDTCAGEALLRAMGGDLTDRFGNHIRYSPEPSAHSV